jgi:ribonuclease E
MPKRMLIDASHPEETRVVVLDGQRVDEFDFESASKRPLKGNIYLAKVTRVEPSLQAAFVEYGGNRQGFLAFSEIHPDYYQIPVADRQALIAEQQEEARRRADDEFEAVATGTAVKSDEELAAEDGEENSPGPEPSSELAETEEKLDDEEHQSREEQLTEAEIESGLQVGFADRQVQEPDQGHSSAPEDREAPHESSIEALAEEEAEEGIVDQQAIADAAVDEAEHSQHHIPDTAEAPGENDELIAGQQTAATEAVPAADTHERESGPAQPLRAPRPPQRWVRRRHYKIQEVIKRKQVMLVQVVKEERGTKGAALTTYLSLAGRYCVLMPNTPRGGGISRKITNAVDRNRLKSAAATLELPEGMGLIIRTAGANRTKLEIKRDYEYLLRLWDQIRELTLQSNAPACVYEEGDIIKRAIRDLYNKDVSEIVVEGDEGYKNAKEFMRMLMPSHAKNVKQYRDPVPVFQKHHIEAQLDAMFQPTVTLKSGGYIVINQTEALVSIDVNSGKATREHSIEETAHKTNLEAADEVARQLRLRDLAGLIVIDFIDMEDSRNDRDVERRLRDAVKHDRARVQIGKISQFGLLEMSRQRLRAGVVASSTIPCPHCGGQGIVRSVESTALRVLRALDEEGQKQRAQAVLVRVADDVALYTLNQKRRELARIETDYGMTVTFEPKEGLMAGTFDLERTALRTHPLPSPRPVVSAETAFETPTDLAEPIEEPEEDRTEAGEPAESTLPSSQAQQPMSNGSKKRRRRRRGRGGTKPPVTEETMQGGPTQAGQMPAGGFEEAAAAASAESSGGSGTMSAGNMSAQGAQTGGSKRKRRRRRKPRSASDDRRANVPTAGGQQPGSQEHSSSPAPQHPFGESESAVTPNASSEPVWGFGSDRAAAVEEKAAEPIGEVYYRREEVSVAETRPAEGETEAASQHAALASGASEAEPSPAAEAEKSQSTRRGWWQRKFRHD